MGILKIKINRFLFKLGFKKLNFHTKTKTINNIDKGRVFDSIMWSQFDPLDIQTPEKMFRLVFENGFVECNETHEWNLIFDGKIPSVTTISTLELFNNKSEYIGNVAVGNASHKRLLIDIEEISADGKLVRCIALNNCHSDNHLFAIKPDSSDLNNLEIKYETTNKRQNQNN